MPTMPISEGSLHYEVHGAGPPLLLVAGLGGVGSFWGPQLAALTPHFTVVVHDHRGTGASSRDLIEYSVPQMAADVLALADGLGLGSFHYLGHSTGAAIGQELAMRHPERMLSAVLSSGWARRDPWFARCFELRSGILREAGAAAYVRSQALFLYPPWWVDANGERLAAIEAAQVAAFPPEAIVQSRIAAITAYGPGEALRAVRTPTLVICADDDHLTPPHLSVEMHGLIPGSRLAILPTGGHFNPTARAEDFNAVVLGWLLATAQGTAQGTAWTAPGFVREATAHMA